MKTYIIGSNMPGYLPDEVPYTADTLEDAKKCLAGDISAYLESINLDSRYSDKDVKKYVSVYEEFDRALPQECNVYIADKVFWITSE